VDRFGIWPDTETVHPDALMAYRLGRASPVYTLHLNSDAGYAVVPLTLLGAPVNIGSRDARPVDQFASFFTTSVFGGAYLRDAASSTRRAEARPPGSAASKD